MSRDMERIDKMQSFLLAANRRIYLIDVSAPIILTLMK